MEIVPNFASRLKRDVCPNIVNSIAESVEEIAKHAQFMLKTGFQSMPEASKRQFYVKIHDLAQSSLVDCQYIA